MLRKTRVKRSIKKRETRKLRQKGGGKTLRILVSYPQIADDLYEFYKKYNKTDFINDEQGVNAPRTNKATAKISPEQSDETGTTKSLGQQGEKPLTKWYRKICVYRFSSFTRPKICNVIKEAVKAIHKRMTTPEPNTKEARERLNMGAARGY